MKMLELNMCYDREWIEQEATAVEMAEHSTWSWRALSWKEMLKHIFAKKANFQSFCALNTANSIIDLEGEKRKQ